MNIRLLRSAQRALLFALSMSAGIAFTGGATSLAQPLPQAYFNQSLVPPDVPSNVLIGDTITFKVRFRNTGNIGFGPFIDLALNFRGADNNSASGPCDGINFISAQMVDVNGGPIALTNTTTKYGNTNVAGCSALTATHPYAGVGVTFPQGWQLVTLGLPFGSFDQTQPEIVVEVTAQVHSYADAAFPLAVCERGGFQFGATGTVGTSILESGATNNVGTWSCEYITPEVFNFKKEYLGPENETATGPNFIHKYKITLDVAAGQTIGKPLRIQDCMPDGMAYQGNLSVTSPNTWPPHIAAQPAIGSVGGCLDVSWINIAAVGVSGPDATVQFDFSIANQYSDGNEVLDDTCKPILLDNPLFVSGNWTPNDPRDTSGTVTGGSGNAHELSAKCIAIQKSVKNNNGLLVYKPGDLVQYTLSFQISDYKTIGQIKIIDQLSDGQIFQTGPAPVLTIGDQFGNHIFPLLPAHYTATPDPTTTFQDCPVKGSTKLSFDVSGALAAIPPSHPRQAGGILTGGYASAPTSTIPAMGTLVFYARIGDTFTNVPLPAKYVDKDDPLCNAVDIQGTVYKNVSIPHLVPAPVSPVQIAEDTSASKIAIVTDVLKKSVYAVRRGTSWSCGPSSLGSQPACASGQQVFPGDQVTFRIQYVIPSGDAQSLNIRDWLPLPIFDVGDPDANPSTTTPWTFPTPCPSTATTIPLPGTARCGPTHSTIGTGFPLPTLTVQPGNSIQFSFGTTIFNTSNTPKTIDLLFTLTATYKPMADELFLTNEVQECEQNTFGTTFCQTAITQVQVREPKLSVRKGVIATNNANGLFTQPTNPASTVAQAPAGATFSLAGVSGLVTSAGGPSPIGNLFDSNLSNVDANDLATFAIVIENKGGYPAFNVHLDDFIPWNKSAGLPTCFEIIFSTLSIKNGAGVTVVTPAGFSGANLGILFTNPIPALDASTLISGANIVIITFQVKIISKIQAGCCDNTVNLTQYTSNSSLSSPNFVPAGFGGPFSDTARVCVGPSASAKCIQATSEAHTTPQQAGQSGQVPATIGEIVRFRLITIIPEGTTQNFQIQDGLPVGLTYIPGTARAVFVANNVVTNTLGIPTVPAAHGTAQCPGAPTPTTTISASPSSFPVGTGTAPSFPAAPITITNNDSDPDLEYLVIEFNAQVDNITANQDGTVLPNKFEVRFKDAFAGQTVASDSGQVYVGIVEPKLTLTKTANPTSIGLGVATAVTYTVTIANTGTATAFDLAFKDTLPAGFVAGTVSVAALGCTSATTGLNLSVNCPSPGYSGLPAGGGVTITYQATVTPQTCPATMTNNAAMTWTSLPGPSGTVTNPTGSATAGPSGADNGERNGVTLPLAPNDYQAAGSAPINCVVPNRDLVLSKLYGYLPPGFTYPDGVPFTFTTDCSNPANTSAPHITATVTITSTHSGPNQYPIANAPVGWTCMVTETVTDASGCWTPGIAVTPNPITIQISGPTGVGFKNNYGCPPIIPAHDLSVTKTKWGTGSSGPSETFVVTVQNVGNSPMTGADLSHLTVTDNLPGGGSIVTGYGNTSMTDWNCPPAPTAAPVTCSYIGHITSLAPGAGLPQLQFIATPGTGNTQYIDPATGAIVNTNAQLNCVVISLRGTGTNHDDLYPANNVDCISM